MGDGEEIEGQFMQTNEPIAIKHGVVKRQKTYERWFTYDQSYLVSKITKEEFEADYNERSSKKLEAQLDANIL